MNNKYCRLTMFDGNKPCGHQHLPEEYIKCIKKMMQHLRYDTPLEPYESIGVSFEPVYVNFIKNKYHGGTWYKEDYTGPETYVHIYIHYYWISGWHKNPVVMPKYDMDIIIKIKTLSAYVRCHDGTPTNYCPLNYLARRIDSMNQKVFDEMKMHLEYSEADIKHERELAEHRRRKNYNKIYNYNNGLSWVEGWTNFHRATIFYNDGTTKIVYKHNNWSYTIETFNAHAKQSEYEEIDGDDASNRIANLISRVYLRKEGKVIRQKTI